MIQSLFSWRTGLALIAIAIVSGTIIYSQYLAQKIIREESQKVEQWVEASKAVLNNAGNDLALPNLIRNEQTAVPIIETNERDSIVNYINLDSAQAAQDSGFLKKKLREFRAANKPIELVLSDTPYVANKYYYGNTALLNEVRYFPLIQLFVVALFIFVTIVSITTRNQSTQNQVWAGMAKETAHQLGTPISSLQGWVEMLKENPDNDFITPELQKDVDRLKLVSDRFGKIGSRPQLEEVNLVEKLGQMIEYIRKRATGKVVFGLDSQGEAAIHAKVSPLLFDWVIENLLKNALDAMEGRGEIAISIRKIDQEVFIDVRDTGKGISAANLTRIFKPGFTTKKRGWGLGLSLSKRIIEQYHKGQLFVKHSEPGKGTTFRIVLKEQ
ncbi:MAG: HAMP domain-containing histidine kinase [Williamsia sp.]|nr:HAMP domain-containing histidine kinase [Williamsia sp.]